jgi:DNA-binding GntR family transcriptional regulator
MHDLRAEISPADDNSLLTRNLGRVQVTRSDKVADQIYRRLRQAILGEEIRAGTRLRETEVAAALKVSRTPVREAISRLIGDWLVRELPAGGVQVTDVMSEIAEIYHIREALEVCAARLAATRITPKQLEKLDALVKHARHASFKERVHINQEFHLTIAEASGSPRLLAMIRSFREYFLGGRWISRQDSKMARRALNDHKRIVAALRDGSAKKVESIMREHLALGHHELISGTQAE